MRFLIFLLFIVMQLVGFTQVAQKGALSGYIAKLEKEIADAKKNNADPATIARLEKILEEMKFTQMYLDQGVVKKPKANTKIGDKWTGMVTFEGTVIHANAAYNGKEEIHASASFIDAMPTLFRDDGSIDLDFTDDKGKGYHKVHTEITDILKRKCIGDCEGNGQSELHAVVVNEETNTYDIDVLFPRCVGTSNCQENGIYEADSRSATASNQQLTNKNILAGTNSVSGELPGSLGTYTRTTTWYLERSTSEDELIVTPEDYDNWLPVPGKDEYTKGSVIKISLEVFGKNGGPLSVKAKSFELKLEKTSKEPGYCINMPLIVGKTLPDLAFVPAPGVITGNNGQVATVNSKDGKTGEVEIAAYDGGGYTTLKATAIMEDNSKLEGHLLISGGRTDIPIPKRPAGSNIGEAWLVKNNNPGDTDDKETSKDNNYDGDGLSAYEEYRGVLSEGKFKRLDPNKKELGVKMKKAEKFLFFYGTVKFEAESGVTVIRFFENEIGTDRKLNKNKLTAHIYDQYALFLQKGALTGDLGKSFGGPGIPKLISKTVIDQNRIGLSYQARVAEARDMNMTLTYTESDLFATVTAHELAHSVNVKHHGSMAPNSMNLIITPDKTTVRIFNHLGIEQQKPYHITGRAGDTGNEQSGDVNCFMVNNALCDWAFKQTPDSAFFYQVPLIPLGTILCKEQKGTGLNSLKDNHGNYKYFGDALNGNCLSQIKLK